MESTSIHINNPVEFRREALAWANQFPIFAFYDSNGYGERLQHYDWILAVDSLKTLAINKCFIQMASDVASSLLRLYIYLILRSCLVNSETSL